MTNRNREHIFNLAVNKTEETAKPRYVENPGNNIFIDCISKFFKQEIQ